MGNKKQTFAENAEKKTSRGEISVLGGLFKKFVSPYKKSYYFCGIKVWSKKASSLQIARGEIEKLHFSKTIEHLEQHILQIEQNFQEQEQLFSAKLRQTEEKLSTTLCNQTVKFETLLQEIQTQITALTQQQKQDNQHFLVQINDVTQSQQSLITDFQGQIAVLRQETMTLRQNSAKQNQNLSTLLSDTQNNILHLTDNLQKLEKETAIRVQTLQEDADKSDKSIRQEISHFQKQTANDYDNFCQRFENFQSQTKIWQDKSSETDTHIQAQIRTLEKQAQQVDETLHHLCQADEQTICKLADLEALSSQQQKKLAENIKGLEDLFSTNNKQTEEQVHQLATQITESDQIFERYQEDLRQRLMHLDSQTEEVEKNFVSLKEQKEDLQENLQKLEQKTAQHFADLSAADEQLQNNISKVKIVTEQMSEELNKNIQSAREDASLAVQEQSKIIEQIRSQYIIAKETMQEQSSSQNEKIQQLCQQTCTVEDKLELIHQFVRTSRVIDFNDVSLPLLKGGFYMVENWGCWLQKHAYLLLRVTQTQQDFRLTLKLNCFYPEHEKTLAVYANGQKVGSYSSQQGTNELCLNVSKYDIPTNGFISLEFATDYMESPLQVEGSADNRLLGFGLIAMEANQDILTFGLDSDLFQALWVQKQSCSFNNEEWEEYFRTHNIEKETSELKQNLPEESQKLIDEFIARRKNPYIFSAFECAQHKLVSKQNLSQYQIADTTGFQPEVFYFKNGLKFLDENIIKAHLSGRDVIDGGACSGDSALMFSQYDEVNKIYAFEPIHKSFENLQKTLVWNNCTKAEAVNAGLSDTDGQALIMGEMCKTWMIDSFAQDKKIGCIKLDVEGMETKVLHGATDVIKRDKPLLLICLYHRPLDFFGIKKFLENFDLGYKFMVQDTEPCNEAIGIHLMLIAYQPL